ncbi:MAG: flagellar type III secretion system pore protein FliP [Synergistetes bacterium]|nr:flagellar type III secretion system pore protein FliP [Synergistota bacterium]MDW8193044.1 flagellar type III secretion system pore protein FliP [Synergistota bacterium]
MEVVVWAQPPPVPVPRINLGFEPARGPEDVALSLQILFILTVLSLAPAIILMVTSFTRIIVVLSFIRNALATQQLPPTQVLVGLALFLTLFVMMPVWSDINANALQPYLRGEIPAQQALEKAVIPLREFMFRQTREKDIALMVRLAKMERPKNRNEVPTHILIPAFMLSELKTSFEMGVLIYVPFIIIDMVVASVLMSMGMIMLPPMMISLPFKILLFVLVDGWDLVVGSLVASFK